MGYLDRYDHRRILLDVSEDANTSVSVNILGFELVAICTPADLDGATNDIQVTVDPGDGLYRTVTDKDGTALSFSNIGTGEYLQVPSTSRPVAGVNIKLEFSEIEDADRTFILVLVALSGSAD